MEHFHLDHLRSALPITDDNGQRVSSHKYWPFGARLPVAIPMASGEVHWT